MNLFRHIARHPVNTLANLKFRVPKKPSANRYVFILGVPRSGTTLLKTNLVSHSQIGGCDYESTGILGLRDIFSYRMGDITPAEIDKHLESSSDIIQFYDRIAEHVLQQTQKRHFVDKLQVRKLRLVYAAHYFPDSVFIHIVRDGRDCFCSALHHPNVPQSATLVKFARYWKRCVSIPMAVIPQERLFSLRYEDLVADPEASLRRLMEFIGLDYLQQQVDVSVYSATTSITKRGVHANLSKPINTASTERWRKDLSSDENDLFVRIAEVGLSRFGYSLS